MTLTFRFKLLAIAGTSCLAFILLILVGRIVERGVERELTAIREHYVPKSELGPQLEAQLERLSRRCQDAIASQDREALEETRALLQQFHLQLAANQNVLDGPDVAALGPAVDDYYDTLLEVSRRLIAKETGEDLVGVMKTMQLKQAKATDLLKKATGLDKATMSHAFAAVEQAQATAGHFRFVVSAGCLIIVVLLSLGLSRSVLRSMRDLCIGVQRFGRGDFSQPIVIKRNDEMGEVARQANQMAESLGAQREELRQTNDELAKRATELESKNSQLDEAQAHLEQKAGHLAAASAFKSKFLANMSHELRTPLNSIIGFAELLHDGVVSPNTPQHKEFLGDILTSGRHLLQLINDVLDLSKVEAGKLEFRPEPIVLPTLVAEVMAIMRTTAAAKQIRMESQIDASLGKVMLDPARLKQVLYNYLSNALKFTPSGGQVVVRLGPDGPDRFVLEVDDTGPGIAATDLGRLFTEFGQIGTAGSRKQEGTGLGLALSKRLVEAQGGTIGVRTEVGKGSTFLASLPRGHAEAAPEIASRSLSSSLALPSSDARSILVVEDSAADQKVLVDALSIAGYAVHVVATGNEAVAICRHQAFDAITLDLLLPDMSGLEVLRQIRAESVNQDVPVFVITIVAERGAVAGFAVHDILAKPLDVGHLVESLKRAGVAPTEASLVLVVDDDASSLKLMAAALAQLGVRTHCARGGESALGVLQANPPSAVVLDLMMPGMDGFEFLDRFRQVPEGQHVPVIVWSAKDLSFDERDRLRRSAQAIIAKGRQGTAPVLAELQTFLMARSREM